MEGDLNLSQALGGLRIANQTDDSPPRSPSPSIHSSETRNGNNEPPSQIHIPDLQSLEAMTPISGTTAANSSSSLPLGQQQQSSSVPHPHPYQPIQQRSTYPGTSAPASRNSSQFMANYAGQSNPYPSNNSNASNTSQYTRMSREPSKSSLHGAPGLVSRPSHRDRPNQERTYRQSPPSGPYPPRGDGYPDGGAAREPGGAHDYHENAPLPSSEEWKEKGAATEICQEVDANGNVVQRIVKKGVKDFNFGRTLGEGSYSTVSCSGETCFLLFGFTSFRA